MKRTLLAAAALCSCSVHAEVYQCPQNFPGGETPAIPLTGAIMTVGEKPTSGPPFPQGWLKGDTHPTRDGIDIEYGLDEETGPKWLICEYGSDKRNKGRYRNGHEWGQYMEGHGRKTLFILVAPIVTDCKVRIREGKRPSLGASIWTVTATCK